MGVVGVGRGWRELVKGGGRDEWKSIRVVEASAAAPRGSLDWRALDLDVGLLRATGGGTGAHPLLDLSRHGHEGLLHISGTLGAGLEEGDPQVVSKLLTKDTGRRRTLRTPERVRGKREREE